MMASRAREENVDDTLHDSKRAPLARDRVLRAALELADEGGTAALTMQRIGRRLGVEAMSLYRHVRNKDDILDGIVDLVFAEIELPADRSNWRTVLRAKRSRPARPCAGILGRSRHEMRLTPGPANFRTHEDTITVLLDAGCSAVMAVHAYNLVDSYVLGFALQEVNFPFSNAEELAAMSEEVLANLQADEYPNSARVARELLTSGFDYADEFEFGLDLILDALGPVLPGA